MSNQAFYEGRYCSGVSEGTFAMQLRPQRLANYTMHRMQWNEPFSKQVWMKHSVWSLVGPNYA